MLHPRAPRNTSVPQNGSFHDRESPRSCRHTVFSYGNWIPRELHGDRWMHICPSVCLSVHHPAPSHGTQVALNRAPTFRKWVCG